MSTECSSCGAYSDDNSGLEHYEDCPLVMVHSLRAQLAAERKEKEKAQAALVAKVGNGSIGNTAYWQDRAEKAERERDEAIEALENEQAKGIHTCHDNCQRPMCVLRRELDEARILRTATQNVNSELRKQRDEAQSDLATYRRAHDDCHWHKEAERLSAELARVEDFNRGLGKALAALRAEYECPKCGGSGETSPTNQYNPDDPYDMVPCPDCRGTGSPLRAELARVRADFPKETTDENQNR